jgi:hypothetical protein
MSPPSTNSILYLGAITTRFCILQTCTHRAAWKHTDIVCTVQPSPHCSSTQSIMSRCDYAAHISPYLHHSIVHVVIFANVHTITLMNVHTLILTNVHSTHTNKTCSQLARTNRQYYLASHLTPKEQTSCYLALAHQ